MDASQETIWFIGDLGDPWVVAIADALPAAHGILRVDCRGELPAVPSDPACVPRLIVIHRQRLVPGDAERLKEWRTSAPNDSPALILCVGPYIRYEELERYSGLVDLVLSEATAAEVLPRHVTRLLDGRQGRSPRSETGALRVLVASANGELGRVVAEACTAAGYRAEEVEDQFVGARPSCRSRSSNSSEMPLTIWDVPLLEPWPERLERHALATGPVIALMGFADRKSVALARSKGAFACFELPLNLDDLVDALDRFSRLSPLDPKAPGARAEPAHHLPPRPRRPGRTRTGRTRESEWPPPARPPTIA